MMGITEWLISIFGADNYVSLVIVLFIVMFLDAILIPTVPELFFITILSYEPGNIEWVLVLLGVSIVAEASGVFLLWYATKHFKIPSWIKKGASTYVDYMIIPNEKMVFVNRFAPMLPFTGAFSAIMDWDIRKVLAYNAAGCVIKYGFFAFLGGSMYAIFGDNATLYTILFTLMVMAAGVSCGLYRRKKRKEELEAMKNEKSDSRENNVVETKDDMNANEQKDDVGNENS